MTDLRRASLIAVLLVSTAVTVAACGGGAAATPVSGEATPASDVTPEPGATEAPATTEEPTATVRAIPTFDLGALTGAIPGVDSYRTSFSINGVEQYQSVVVTQPVLSKAITTFDNGAVSTRFVVIGKDVWSADGVDGRFEAVPAAMANSMLLAFDPTLMLGGYANADLANGATDQGVEQKNGVQARHVRIDSTTLVGVAAAMPAGSAIDLWIAEAGYIVAWEMSGFAEGQNMSIQVTGVDDPANKVETPN